MRGMSLIGLATDFGDSVYVGEMKAVILARAPAARVVDLFHSVSPQCVLEGAFLLSKSWPFFPEGSILVAVVDPGVGSDRRILAVRAHRRTFLAPDNGLLSFISKSDVEDMRVVENRSFFLPHVSATFHGRDIFAPVAGALAKCTPLAKLGRRTSAPVRLSDLSPVRRAGGLEGKIVHVDRFGNLVTNLSTRHAPRAIVAGRRRFRSAVRTYSDAPEGRPVILKGSFDTWEIVVKNGSAAHFLKLPIGSPVRQELS